jgi:hypothetical protein
MSGFKVNFSVNNQLATPSMHAAALANRPAAGQPGRVFIDTDNPSTGIYRDTGTAWVQIAETGASDVDTLQNVTDNGNTTDNTLILTYDSLFNGSNQIEFFDIGTTAVRYSINKVGTGNRLTIQGNSPLSTFDMGLMIDAPNNTLRTYFGSSFETKGISLDFTNNIYRLGNVSGTAGEQGIYINATGQVGIGTTSVNSSLEINKAAGTNYIYLTNGTSGSSNGVVLRFNNTDYMGMIGTFTSGELKVGGFNAGGYFMTFYSNNAERMRLTPSGRLLIGTTTESTFLLDVNGTARVKGDFVDLDASSNERFKVTDNGSSGFVYTFLKRFDNTKDIFHAIFPSGTLSNTNVNWNMGMNGSSNNFSFTSYNGTSTTERLSITNTGSVGIGTTSPNASALLDVSSTTKGFLPPRMTTAQINAISTPAEGLIAFNTTISHLCVYQGGAWVRINHSPM